jgi:hypothetical protein
MMVSFMFPEFCDLRVLYVLYEWNFRQQAFFKSLKKLASKFSVKKLASKFAVSSQSVYEKFVFKPSSC